MRNPPRRRLTTRPSGPLAVLAGLLTAALLHPAWAGPLTTSAQAGYNPAVTLDDGSSASANHSSSNPDGTSASSTAFASPSGLSVMATSTGIAPTGPQYGAGASFTVVEDTTFNYQPDYLGGQDDWVEVGLTGVLSGNIIGEKQGGTGSGRARVSISGNLWTAPPEEGGVFIGSVAADTGDRGGSVRSFNESQNIEINEFVSTGYFWVPRGAAVTLFAGLSVQVFSDKNPFAVDAAGHGTVTADFSNTFEFDPFEFFDIRSPGVTANSPSLGLVDNQLIAFIDDEATTVPAPGGLALLLAGLVGLVLRRRAAKA